jgi:RNase P/RNase MRP subunit p30
MTRFCDLRLCVPLEDPERTRCMIQKSSELGYGRIGVPFPAGVEQGVVEQVRRICEDFGLDLVTRLDLSPRSPGELLDGLRRFRRGFEVVSVVCGSKPVARQAAKDRRVDLLVFSGLDRRRRFFDWAEAELASRSSAALEISLAQVLVADGFQRVGLLSILRREVMLAKSCGVSVVFSSGASDVLLLRRPRDFAALAFVFGVDASFAVRALSASPMSIVEGNRKKQSGDYVAPGVRVVRRKGSR